MNISVNCADIQTPVGFEYKVPPDRLNYSSYPDCKQSWYLQDGGLIADPSYPQILVDPAVSVSSVRLVTSRCVNLIHQIICHSADGTPFRHKIMFKVRNETAVTPNSGDLNTVTPDGKTSDEFWRHWDVLFVLLLLLMISTSMIIILVCLIKHRRIPRDPEAAVKKLLRSEENKSS
ncbi:hypothetical protein Q8A67_001536 [Cirrhinus molitorella]|uniref:Uncharacterized protein n=1 Tax=Cirrhinus molitorella TaxID=172907 RepID=A0AA88QEI3_9TELE|nr:hypothetical protein Q8A67_001536 [Cirrhinus molitorella]